MNENIKRMEYESIFLCEMQRKFKKNGTLNDIRQYICVSSKLFLWKEEIGFVVHKLKLYVWSNVKDIPKCNIDFRLIPISFQYYLDMTLEILFLNFEFSSQTRFIIFLNEIVYSFLVMKELFETNSILPQNTHVWGESYLGIIRKYIISFWTKFKEKA